MKTKKPYDVRKLFDDYEGGAAEMARTLGMNTKTIHWWKKNGVPAQRCYQVAALTGISPERLRPDIFTTDPVIRVPPAPKKKPPIKRKQRTTTASK